MTTVALVQLGLKVSLGFTVFALGLSARPGDARYLLNHRGLLGRSLLAIHVIMPVAALGLTSVIPVHPAVRLALVATMISPIPAALPSKAMGVSGDTEYGISLFAIVSLLSVVIVPATIAVIGSVYGASMHVPPRAVAQVVFAGVVIPLALGLVVARRAPGMAERIANPLSKAANIVLLLAVVPLLVMTWPAIRELLGNATLIVIAVLVIIAMAVGQLLGGPGRDTRSVLALATASRHPGVAIAVAAATFPSEQLAPAAVLLAALFGALLSRPFVRSAATELNLVRTSAPRAPAAHHGHDDARHRERIGEP